MKELAQRYAFAVVLAGLLLGGLVGGCDGREASVERAEAFLKERSSPRGKAGILRALEVVHRAHKVAEGHGEAEQPDCRLRVPEEGAYTYQSTLTLERNGGGERGLRWHETRTTRRDRRGRVEVILAADARSARDKTSSHQMSWRVVDGTSYVSGDADSFYARPADLDQRERVVAAGWGTLQTLLDAASDGWQREAAGRRAEEDAHVWTVGGERLRCGPAAPTASGWLRSLAAHATPVSGRLEASAQRVARGSSAASRTLELRWQLDDRTMLDARFKDRLRVGRLPADAPIIAAPRADDVLVAERDRSLETVDRLLDELTRQRAIERRVDSISDESAKVTGTDDESK
ncbi:MAG: hypothetical protein ACLFVJ_01620 [Persicimonas sp.]